MAAPRKHQAKPPQSSYLQTLTAQMRYLSHLSALGRDCPGATFKGDKDRRMETLSVIKIHHYLVGLGMHRNCQRSWEGGTTAGK